MPETAYFRGGADLTPRKEEVKFDPVTGLVGTTHGVSVFDDPQQVERFGGAFRLELIPESLRIIQRGRDPRHFEIVPVSLMSWDEYNAALGQVQLAPAAGSAEKPR